ncbi:hypothetical protein EV586_102642 [Tumebacillus sp. BK434]|uniref:hypothetical protein n=1 Tax=Tumebacillus sp. BK434 TaxID=2512169 RepID=UPI0010D57829|nr:hypothetical protein [Tumebacillus sp. BK434]TCP58189.1 hypothetical protein EV586_102642 [Tumebacillus sp. BK434]
MRKKLSILLLAFAFVGTIFVAAPQQHAQYEPGIPMGVTVSQYEPGIPMIIAV